MSDAIESPCVAVCKLQKGDKYCRGCFRTLEEIATWGQMTSAARREIMEKLRDRARA